MRRQDILLSYIYNLKSKILHAVKLLSVTVEKYNDIHMKEKLSLSIFF